MSEYFRETYFNWAWLFIAACGGFILGWTLAVLAVSAWL